MQEAQPNEILRKHPNMAPKRSLHFRPEWIIKCREINGDYSIDYKMVVEAIEQPGLLKYERVYRE